MKYLGTEYQSDKFILTGICSGAKIAYEAQCNDAKVVGAAPINIRCDDFYQDVLPGAILILVL